jgi:hypothetical protein
MKSHPVGAEVFHADGQTDIIQLMVAFRNSANAPKEKKEWTSVRRCGSVSRDAHVAS